MSCGICGGKHSTEKVTAERSWGPGQKAFQQRVLNGTEAVTSQNRGHTFKYTDTNNKED